MFAKITEAIQSLWKVSLFGYGFFLVSRYCLFVCSFVGGEREREGDDIVRMMVSFRVEFGSVGEFNWDKC